jgi:hypothetical protein
MKKKTAQKNATIGTKTTAKAASAKAAKTPKTPKTPKATTTKKSEPVSEPKANTKTAIVLGLLRREKGATIAEIAKATKWQNHTIRGFISASVGKKMGLKVESAKNDAGERAYRIVT